ncbi:MAG: DNA primase [Rhodospirillaceae bacterium]|nr:MAG: DNA primase [Rhodospirillaceae bacterium]
MSLPPAFLDMLRLRRPLATVVGQGVRLVRRGREYVGLCPFHKEKTPSFTVNEDKGFYYCFGCGAHGDVIDFVMHRDGVSFKEAVERLSREAGIEVPRASPQEREKAKRQATLLEVMEAAAAFYERQLRLPAGQAGRTYLHGRGLAEEVIARFRLGFAPGANACKAALKREGVAEDMMRAAGLLVQPDGDRPSYDTFRERVMFPITNVRGQVIAFGGRVLGTAQPKYLNSPDTALFQKGTVLYGLAQARDSAIAKGTLVVTEGYMDVITLAGAGFSHVVAPLGTALTEEQMTQAWRLAPEPVLCFDGDGAGQRAAARAAERVLPLLKPGVSVRFALLPEGKDPDDLVRTEGAFALATLLEAALPLSEALWRSLWAGRKPATPEQWAALEQDIKTLTERIADSSIRSNYRSLLYERLRTERAQRQHRGRAERRSQRQTHNAPLAFPYGTPLMPRITELTERVFTAFLLAHPPVLIHHAEQAAEALAGNKDLAGVIESAVLVLTERPELNGAEVVSALGGVMAGLERYLASEFQRQRADPEGDWQHMLSALHDQALAHEIESLQTVLATHPSPEAWRRLLCLQHERRHLHEEAG